MCDMNCIRWGARNLTREEVLGKRVIEVGSYDVNGSLRYIVELLEPAAYIGVDVVKGPGVDVVCSAGNLVQEFGRESFELVLSTCTLEHIREWKEAISNMKNICRANGTILIIVPSHWPFHEFPHDFWRYGKEDIRNIFSDCDILALDEDPQPPSLVYGKIRKPNGFTERELSGYPLYSVIADKRIGEIHEKDLNDFYFRRLPLRDKIRDIVSRKARTILPKSWPWGNRGNNINGSI
jgi:SAM-dependent methyltransferase